VNSKLIILFLIIAAFTCILIAWRWFDHRADTLLWQRFVAYQPTKPQVFDPTMVAGLPDPARRYFEFTIETGTRLYTVSEIYMNGDFSLGSKAEPDYMPMQAKQIIAAPYGFVWKLKAGKIPMQISGSDAAQNRESWSRFWVFNLLPVARAGGDADHAKAAFGRYIAEAVFWSPAALLPSANTKWQLIDGKTARVTVKYEGLEQSVDLTVDEQGRPVKVLFQRWSNANSDKTYRLQPFGGYLSNYKEFEGFHLPTHVEAGNHFETEAYFPFFRADVIDIRFPNKLKQR